MKRREFIKLIGGAAASWPVATQAEQQAMPVIGFVSTTVGHSARFLENVRKGLAEYGYIEGQNFRFEILETNFQNERIPILYRQLVEQKVTLIIAVSTMGLQNAKAATETIPVVFSIGSDPVENGFVASLNKPGGSLTGIYSLGVMLSGKRLEVLHEMIPSVAKLAFLADPGNTTFGKLQTQQIQAAANSLGLGISYVYAHNPDEFDAAFQAAVREGAGGMVIGADALFAGGNATTLAAVAGRYRLPAIYVDDVPVKSGGLISYAADQDEPHQFVGRYAGRILKGEKPADIPVQLSTRTTLIINLKTAKAMGITVPTPLLVRADEVIE
jgi:putative tryptophan/tyrosine transport system substrate-binding protein